MKVMELQGMSRKSRGTRRARALRETGRIPAVVYGHGEPPESIALELHDVEVALSHGARMLKVNVDGQLQHHLIKDVQYDHLNQTPVHLDLMRVSMHEKVRVTVGISLRGVPKGIAEGGVLDQSLSEIEVECLATDIPETLHPLVLHLGLGEALFVKDLQVPPGVTVLTDPEERVAVIRAKVEEVEAAPGEAVEGESVQPEVIGRGKKEEGEGEA